MRAAEQVLDLYETFAATQAPLALSELARKLRMPASTCFNLIRTFESRGYLYAAGDRRALYPTKRMLMLTQEISLHDPVGDEVLQRLAELRDITGETVVLSSRTRGRVTYLAVVESRQRIRYSAKVGETRPIEVNSMGKALMSLLTSADRRALAADFAFERLTDKTLDTPDAYLADIERSISRGWFLNDGESVADVIAIAVPVVMRGFAFAVTVAGPRHRMGGRIEACAEEVMAACRDLASEDAAHEL